MSIIRTRWAAIGALVATTLGGGGVAIVSAAQPDGALAFVPIAPCRVMDTRAEFAVGPRTSPLGTGETYTVNTTTSDTGNCTEIPLTARSVSMNVTAIDATLPTFIVVWATGTTQPAVSNLNPVPGSPPTPNAVTTGINANGQFDVFNLQGDVHVIADVNGYYTDHRHDDRYYTKAQVDLAIAATIDDLPVDTAALESRISALEAALAAVTDPSGNWAFPGDVAIAGSVSVGSSVSAGGGASFGKSLAVAGDAAVNGGATISGPLAAGGDATLGRSLSVGNGLAVGGALAVDDGASVGADLSVDGSFAAGRDTVLGRSLQVGAGLSVGGPVAAGGDVITNGDFIDNTP
ncbi:MAG: hypothetical protein R8G01_00660 [Ilumatobacteraceae bacterium]|nr:hypothetical protein [Ilumatobacteraceae bacterium]